MVMYSSSHQEKLFEVGLLLQQTREGTNWTIEDMAKKLGLRAEQILAIEEGNSEPFNKNAQPMIWYARLYAKKLGIELPELVFMDIKRASGTSSQPSHNIPAFLMAKKTNPSE
jgi:transcriptional regulator with XRE-family HTH domain